MFLIKILLGILCVHLCSKIAITKANAIKESYLFWESASTCCGLLLQEFSYKKRPIKSLIEYNYLSSDFLILLSSYVKNEELEFPSYINFQEEIRLKSFFEELGKSDSETQKLAINSYKTEFSSLSIEKKAEYKKQYSLTLKVGFSIGVMLFIMVI